MALHIDTNDPKYKRAAAEILRRHNRGEPEANITSAVRNFLTATGLVKDEEIVEENPPAQGSRRAVDLAIDYTVPLPHEEGLTSRKEVLRINKSGSPGRIRTYDLAVNSRPLYR